MVTSPHHNVEMWVDHCVGATDRSENRRGMGTTADVLRQYMSTVAPGVDHDLQDRRDRGGSGSVRFTRLRLFGSDVRHDVGDSVRSGHPVSLV